MRFVSVKTLRPFWDVRTDESVLVMGNILQYGVDLGIRQMLQYLTNQAQIGVWQPVDGQIRTQKTNAVVAEADLVTSHHGLNDIHADVLHPAARGDPLAHLKVTASEIGNALDASALNKFDDLADIGLSSNPNGARTRIVTRSVSRGPARAFRRFEKKRLQP
jgi:hypothetical protein